jgi:hypothetical protein
MITGYSRVIWLKIMFLRKKALFLEPNLFSEEYEEVDSQYGDIGVYDGHPSTDLLSFSESV